ncbi:hypothetical protein F4678DRAFT_149100 [Xylaria arbuscula]|nr:hypothetical protein F4678DRAFT_149100 [Xylaria arbuscula]
MDPQQMPSDSYKETVNYTQPGLEVTSEPTKTWAPGPAPPTYTRERTIFGIRRATFFLSITLVVVVIVAAVGGGVGGSLAVQNAKSACISNNTSGQSIVTATVTAPAAVTGSATPTTSGRIVATTGVVQLDCPGITQDKSITLETHTWTFAPACGVDYSGSDFGAVVVYTLHDCLQACAAHNHFSGEDECTALTFAANQTQYIPTDYGNCWLKKGNPSGVQSPSGNLVIGAKLIQSDS